MGQGMLLTFLVAASFVAIAQATLHSRNLVGSVTTVPPSTTSTPEPIENCKNLTGRWSAWNPSSILCFEVENTGEMLTLMRNGTDVFFSQGSGMTVPNDYRHVGFTQHSPHGLSGEVSGFSGECHACFGTEVIILSTVSRNKARSPECGVSDGIRGVGHEPYVFTRSGPPCRGMQLEVYNPNPLLLSKMGVRAKSAASFN